MVSRPTIYVVLRRARLQLFVPMSSTNERYKTIKYGIKRLAKIEKTLEDKLRRQAKNITTLILGRWCMLRLNGFLC
ncbi:hypothetical protein [Commensalibacter nepenthis]|nr:hypothetical protein [Commensalibacter sp. TBRC 10068]MDI2113740.1 hypothetical protein [Commensalibacter sp. TBRC 10068]